ncbi:hypothetical protein ACVXG8_21130 [Escherichia coli]
MIPVWILSLSPFAGDKPGEVMRAIEVIGSISCVLLGAYPMVLLLDSLV